MKNKLIFIFLVFIDLNVFSQFSCKDILYDADTLAVANDYFFSGYCDDFDKKGKLVSRSYIGFGVLDSVVYFDKNGLVAAVEPYNKWIIQGILKVYYRSGALKETITYSNDKIYGIWRKYYESGQIKYEGDHISEYKTKDDSYFTWTRKGIKYLHYCKEIEKVRKIGNLTSVFARTKCGKVKI